MALPEPSRHPGRPIGTLELCRMYVFTLAAAAVAAAASLGAGLHVLAAARRVCRRITGGGWYCLDGTGLLLPGLLFGGVAAVVVVAAGAAIIRRRADPPTVRRVARHVLWLGFVLVGGSALLYARDGLTAGAVLRSLLAVAATLVTAVPLVTSYLDPPRTPRVLTICLIMPLAVTAAGVPAAPALPLAVPLAAPLLGYWLTALWLWRAADEPTRGR